MINAKRNQAEALNVDEVAGIHFGTGDSWLSGGDPLLFVKLLKKIL